MLLTDGLVSVRKDKKSFLIAVIVIVGLSIKQTSMASLASVLAPKELSEL